MAGIDITPNKDGGVLKEILTPGEGDETAPNGCTVKAYYHGTFTNGEVFDSCVGRKDPFEFQLGTGSVIKAWDIGIATMKKGEKARLTCKSDYAYGDNGSPPKIPGGSTLIFEITLVSWQEEDLSPTKNGGILRRIIVKGSGYSNPEELRLCKVHLKGTHDGRVFDDRELSFHLEEGSEVGVPSGIEIALTKMVRGEKSRITLAPRYHWPNGNESYSIPADSTIIYEVKLIEFEKKESWDMDATDKIAEAQLLKEKGTDYFKTNKFQLASKLYGKAITYIESDQGYSESESEERKKVLLAIRLNLGLVHLKLKQACEAKNELEKALEIDPDNVKGLFRLGQAKLGMAEPELALKAFERVLKKEPNNAAAVSLAQECKKTIQKNVQREKQLYKNMFDTFAKRDQEKEEEVRKQAPDTMSVLGEWCKEDREREPTTFEKENPDILLLDKEGMFKDL